MDSTSPIPTLLVTGASGFLGQHVLRQAGPVASTVLAPSHGELDLEDEAATHAYVAQHQPTHIAHLAAACGGIQANIERPAEFLIRNARMGLNLLEAAQRSGTSHFLLVSTTCAYPEDASIPLVEADLWRGEPVRATRAYGLSKRFLHEACAQFSSQYGFKSTVLIPANLYGEGDHYGERSHVVAALIKRYVDAKRLGELSVQNWGDGTATREFLHAADAGSAVVQALAESWPHGPINVGTGRETSIRELAELISRTVGYEGRTDWDTSKPTGQPRRALDTTLASEHGFVASTSLEAGLSSAVRDYERRFSREAN